MFRRLIALGLSAAVQAAALGAPLVHAHVDGHDVDHHGATVHAHVAGHPARHHHASDHPGLEASEPDDAVYLQMFVAEPVVSPGAAALPATSFSLTAPDEVPAHRPLRISHALDPPFVTTGPSRAPPSIVLL